MAAAAAVADPVPSPLYIFGYGSLVWKPEPSFVRPTPGFIVGFHRRLWQASTDHRGTPVRPGRVMALVPAAEFAALTGARGAGAERVWGMVYEVATGDVGQVLAELDVREKDGYGRHWVPVWGPDGRLLVSRALVYTSTKRLAIPAAGDGAPGWREIAQAALGCRGESGENWEYIENIAEAVRRMGVKDEHLEGVAAELRKLMGREEGGGGEEK